MSEIHGPESNARILAWHAYTTLKATDDETPYCSSAMCYWMQTSGVESTRSAAARSWMRWGVDLDDSHPLPAGAVVVFWRGKSPKAGMGHVGLYVGGNPADGRISVLGANQHDTTNIETYSVARVLGFRWPSAMKVDRPESWLPLAAVGTSRPDWS